MKRIGFVEVWDDGSQEAIIKKPGKTYIVGWRDAKALMCCIFGAVDCVSKRAEFPEGTPAAVVAEDLPRENARAAEGHTLPSSAATIPAEAGTPSAEMGAA